MSKPPLDMEGLPPEVAEAIKELMVEIKRDRLDTMLSIATQDLSDAGLPTSRAFTSLQMRMEMRLSRWG